MGAEAAGGEARQGGAQQVVRADCGGRRGEERQPGAGSAVAGGDAPIREQVARGPRRDGRAAAQQSEQSAQGAQGP